VLSVDSPNTELKPLSIASSSTLNVGDPVIAIGSPFGLGGSMTSGIVSQLGRTIKESLAGDFPIANIIQISAPINPGNSGGPLFNYDSKVVGITTAIIADSEGVGFAIPSNTILREIESLVNTGSYDQHSWLGVSGADMTYEIADEMNVDITYGWLISQVVHGGSADKAGLRGGTQRVQIAGRSVIVNGDIIIAIDGARIINGDDLMTYIEEHTLPHQIINVTIVRNNQMLGLLVELEKRPSLS
jgi:S1-C subfamily serine protease